ncbi:MAG: DUF421 domain-containing protein [Bacillales bacterium]|nr:DUF421 domain-containing protein [Bacillales bacterium]
MGKRELGQVSTFDIVVFFVISELFSLSLNEPDHSILRSLIPIGIIVILQVLSAFLSLRIPKLRKVFEGKNVIIIDKGKINYENMRNERYNLDDLMEGLFQNHIQSPLEVEYAFLLDSGNMVVIKKSECILLSLDPLIQDGVINKEALKSINMSEDELMLLIKEKGYSDYKKIFFAQLLKDGLYIIPFDELINKK